MLTIRTTEKGIYVSVDGKQEMAHPLGSLRYTCTSTSVRFFPANGYEGLYEGRYGDNFTVNGEPVTKENAQTLLEALFFLKFDPSTKQDTLVSGENIKTVNGMTVLGAGNIVLNQYIQHYKWVSNVATTRKQVPAELRARDVKISYNNASGTYIVEQYQSDDISDASWENDVNWKGCRTALTPLFEAAGAVFNDETGYYEMNGLTDLTEEDMEWMYNLTKTCGGLSKLDFTTFTINGRYIRTNFPFTNVFMACDTLSIYGQAKLEVLCLESITDFNRQPFQLKKFDTYENASLKRVMGEVYVKDVEKTSDLRNIYPTNLNLLEEFFLKFLCVSADIFTYSPLIKLECLDYLVTNARNTVPIIVAVHSTVYAKLMDEANAEWYAVNVAAREKQIAFATTETARAVALAARALPEVATEGGELLAPAGCYLTQAEDTPVADRLFLTRKVLLPGEDTARWRIGTEAERQEQEDYFNNELNKN